MELEIDIECPQCKHKFKQKLRDVKPGASHKCTSCGANITFTGDDLSKAQKELDNLERTIKNISKNLKIKL